MIDNIMEHIHKARIEAQKRHIKVNTIIIDEELARTEHLLIDNYIMPPMIMGLEVKYLEHLTKDYGFNFVLADGSTMQNKISNLELENDYLRGKLKRIEELVGENK